MKKIEKLTKEQEALLTVYRDKWLKIGLSTEPANHSLAEDAMRRAYRIAGLQEPARIVWVTSPIAGTLTISILKNEEIMKKISQQFSTGTSVWNSVRDSVWTSVRTSVWDSVRDSVWDSVWDSVGTSVWDSVRTSVGTSVWDSVGTSVWDSVRTSVGTSVRTSVGTSVWNSVRTSVGTSARSEVYNAGYGQQDAAWLGFYQYLLEVLKIESASKLIPLMDLSNHANWFYPYQNICLISEKPTHCFLMDGRIHQDGGPAIRYPDGFSVWALHGVRVSQELAETPADKLDPHSIMKLPNAEQRKEGIRKIGIDRMRDPLKVEVLHSYKDYELWTIEFENRRIGPYLKMVNPSTGQIHVEGVGTANGNVDDKIKTCQEALAWRGGFKLFSEPKWTA